MKKAQFFVTCIARYKISDFPLPDGFFNEQKLSVSGKDLVEYIEDHLDNLPITEDLEWIQDVDDNPVSDIDVYEDDDVFLTIVNDGDCDPTYL